MKIIVVTGPPCAGKSTYVADRRGPLDVVIDADVLAHALGYPYERLVWPSDQHPARVVMMRARLSAMKAARSLDASAVCWLITTDGIPPGAEVVRLDPGREECLRRAAADGRPASTVEEIEQWYAGRGREW